MISYKKNHKDFWLTFGTISVLCDKINDSGYFPSHLFANYSRPISKGSRKHRYESLLIRRIFCWAQFFLTPIEVFLTLNKI
jgi:hypothetical protein